jgi:glycosyltransferase involved in cell wall biosynthesis
MVPPENPAALASAMQVLVQDAGMRERFGKAGFERAASNFSLDAMFKKTVKIYEQVLQQRKIQAGAR